MLAEDASLPLSPDVVLLLPILSILTSKYVSVRTHGKVFNACVLPYCMVVKPGHLLHQTCSGFAGKTDQWSAGSAESEMVTKCPNTLCAMLGVQEVTAALRTRRLRWYGHFARSSSCINSITSMTIPSARRRGRPKKTWSECVKADMKMSSLGSIDPLNREALGLDVRHSSHLLPTPVPGTPAAVEK